MQNMDALIQSNEENGHISDNDLKSDENKEPFEDVQSSDNNNHKSEENKELLEHTQSSVNNNIKSEENKEPLEYTQSSDNIELEENTEQFEETSDKDLSDKSEDNKLIPGIYTKDESAIAEKEEKLLLFSDDKDTDDITHPKIVHSEHNYLDVKNMLNEDSKQDKIIGSSQETNKTTSYKQVVSGAAEETANNSDNLVSDRSSISVVLRGQARAEQLMTSISQTQMKTRGYPLVKQTRHRIPPKLMRLATIYSASTKSQRVPKGPSLYYVEPQRPLKVITWDEANNARPPLRIDMEGPSPWTYSPKNKPLNETNAPSFTFGTKCYPEKAGGSSTSWGKTWFQPIDPWHNKADFKREGKWPSPNQYHKPSLLGPRQRTVPEAPSYTFGHRYQVKGSKTGVQTFPSPSDYHREKADVLILPKGPSFSHQFRREGTVLWCSGENNPGPAAYTPLTRPRLEPPAYTIQGIRREKSQVLGPFSTL